MSLYRVVCWIVTFGLAAGIGLGLRRGKTLRFGKGANYPLWVSRNKDPFKYGGMIAFQTMLLALFLWGAVGPRLSN